jgi:hypothetical protein
MFEHVGKIAGVEGVTIIHWRRASCVPRHTLGASPIARLS